MKWITKIREFWLYYILYRDTGPRSKEWQKYINAETGCLHTLHEFGCDYCFKAAYLEQIMWGNVYFRVLTPGIILIHHQEVSPWPPTTKGRDVVYVRSRSSRRGGVGPL